MIADVASGHVDGADVLFLIAVILFIIAAVVEVAVKPVVLNMLLLFAGLACTALALLIL
jgi:hypothetical protein